MANFKFHTCGFSCHLHMTFDLQGALYKKLYNKANRACATAVQLCIQCSSNYCLYIIPWCLHHQPLFSLETSLSHAEAYEMLASNTTEPLFSRGNQPLPCRGIRDAGFKHHRVRETSLSHAEAYEMLASNTTQSASPMQRHTRCWLQTPHTV